MSSLSEAMNNPNGLSQARNAIIDWQAKYKELVDQSNRDLAELKLVKQQLVKEQELTAAYRKIIKDLMEDL